MKKLKAATVGFNHGEEPRSPGFCEEESGPKVSFETSTGFEERGGRKKRKSYWLILQPLQKACCFIVLESTPSLSFLETLI